MLNLAKLRAAFSAYGHDLLHSCYDMEWYRGIRMRPVAEALKYAGKLMLAVGVITAVMITPALFSLPGGLRGFVQDRLPDGAEASVDHGTFSASLTMPYVITTEAGRVIVDTSVGNPDIASASADVIALVGRESMVIRQSAAETHAYSFKEVPDFRWGKSDLIDFISKWAPVAALAIWFLALAGAFTGTAAYAFIVIFLIASAAYLLAKVMRVRLAFNQLLAVGLHAITLPLAVDFFSGAFGVQLPFAFLFLTSLIMFAVLADERARPTVSGV